MKQSMRKIRGILIRFLFMFPDKKLHIIGVTGTDGKSTTSEMIYQMLTSSGYKTGLISTIGGKINGEVFDTGLHTSTPSTWNIYSSLKKMKAAGVTHVVLELTSHGLHQERAQGVRLDGCLITNITPEHLDYHKTFEAYRKAKLKIIDMLKPDGVLAINADDSNEEVITKYALERMNPKNIVYFTVNDKKGSKNEILEYKLIKINKTSDGYDISVKLTNLPFDAKFFLEGEYNLQNLMAAVSVCVMLKAPLQGIIRGISQIRNIPGRMNILKDSPYKVIVDFAHTPNAFKQLFSYLRPTTNGRLIVMFGCAGERDHEKRIPMGRIASDYADIIILTAEDPRSENINDIYKDIINGIDNSKFTQNKNLFLIDSREDAIKKAIELASIKDTVALLGKGHEESLAIGKEELPWNESETAVKYIKLKN